MEHREVERVPQPRRPVAARQVREEVRLGQHDDLVGVELVGELHDAVDRAAADDLAVDLSDSLRSQRRDRGADRALRRALLLGRERPASSSCSASAKSARDTSSTASASSLRSSCEGTTTWKRTGSGSWRWASRWTSCAESAFSVSSNVVSTRAA